RKLTPDRESPGSGHHRSPSWPLPLGVSGPLREGAAPMSMFDYDARPATPGVVLVGTPPSRGGYAIRDFLSRNGYPFEWVDAGEPDAVRAVLGVAGGAPPGWPLCILRGG